MKPVQEVLIVGGGTAGWLTAAYLAKTLGCGAPGAVRITLVESSTIGIIGVGEGSFPSLRRTRRGPARLARAPRGRGGWG